MKDTQQLAKQYISTSAETSPYVQEIQQILLPASMSVIFQFRGLTTTILQLGSATFADFSAALTHMHVVGTFILYTTDGVVAVPTALLTSFQIKYTSLVGGLMPMYVTGSTSPFATIVTATRIKVGDAPYRHAVQVLQCSQLDFPVIFSVNGISTQPLSVLDSTIINLTNELNKLGYGNVSILPLITTGPGAQVLTTQLLCDTTVNPANYSSIYVSFDNAQGAVVPLICTQPANPSPIPQVTVQTQVQYGALDGLFPIYGSFKIGINNEQTSALSFDASASDIQQALSAFYSLENISVTKDGYGIPYKNDGITPFFNPLQYVFSIWTITFKTSCYDSNGINTVGYCYNYNGDEELLSIDSSNLQYNPSPYVNQKKPVIISHKIQRGYSGNDIINANSLNDISLALTPRIVESSFALASHSYSGSIGMNVIQELICSSNASVSVSFVLAVLNNSILVRSTYTASEMASVFNTLNTSNSGYSVNITVHPYGSTICGMTNNVAHKTVIRFLSTINLPIIRVISGSANLVAAVYPVINGIDSIIATDVSTGKYRVIYTPTISGLYNLNIALRSTGVLTPISNDFSDGVLILPALEYSATSTHNISQVTKEGVREYFSVQLRDRFGNKLIGPMDSSSSFIVTMPGMTSFCQGDSGVSSVVATSNMNAIQIMTREPYTDGLYSLYYDPTVSGEYDLSVKLVTQGGLLGTYYRTANLTQPLLASVGNFYNANNHNPYWCDGLQQGMFSTSWPVETIDRIVYCDSSIRDCGCDSTRLDASLDFQW